MRAKLNFNCFILFATIVGTATIVLGQQQEAPTAPSADKFIYADFERVENGRPVSNNGGLVQIFTSQETTPVKFKGQADTTAPELVKAKGDEKNHLASFDYSLVGPNQWANVTLEIQG